MKKRVVYMAIIMAVIISFLLYTYQPAKETINFFPIDPSLSFQSASTHLTASESGKRYNLALRVESSLKEPVFLRQDIALLYKNGKLIKVLRDWKQNTAYLSQEDRQKQSESGIFQNVSFHFAEAHPNNKYTSVQTMTDAHLYIIHSKTDPFQSFANPISNDQGEWKTALDRNLEAVTQHALTNGLNAFKLDEKRYTVLPLTSLPSEHKTFFASFPPARQQEIIGRLWEGLYKNYILGIKKEDGTVVEPQNSTIPLLLLDSNHRELFILLTAGDGTPLLLKQQL
ncbi:hypothetical protein ABEV54_08005 [Peribacillus psychrosaccharolyticus]|uniref:hypothetical protein n=1 Tax=Peribacillus psychrosaccharolyticus TaxID=1407 RepID=UPI003D27C630